MENEIRLNVGRVVKYENAVLCFYVVLDAIHTSNEEDVAYFSNKLTQEQQDVKKLIVVGIHEYVVNGKRLQSMCTDRLIVKVSVSDFQASKLKDSKATTASGVELKILKSLRFEVRFLYDQRILSALPKAAQTPALQTTRFLDFDEGNAGDLRPLTQEQEESYETLVAWWKQIYTGEPLSQEHCDTFEEKFDKLTDEDQAKMRRFLNNLHQHQYTQTVDKKERRVSSTKKRRRESMIQLSDNEEELHEDTKRKSVINLSSDEEEEASQSPSRTAPPPTKRTRRNARKLLPASQKWME